MLNEQLWDLRAKYISNGVGSTSKKFVACGKGALYRDADGREYIDFAGGIGAMNIGHSHPKVVAAIKDQAENLTHSCLMVNPYEPAVKLAEKLCHIAPGKSDKKAVFLTSGSEAVENAVKIARYYTKRPGIIVFDNAYHGRTLLTLTMTAKVNPFKRGFGPFAPEIYKLPFGDQAGPEVLLDFFKKNIDAEHVAALIAEPIQGEGGFICPPPDYFQKLAKICRDHGILFVSDEIQAGMGRTGKMWAIENWGVEPDLMTVGKSLAAGLPISGVVGRADIMDSIHPGGVGGTYGGNPLACAAGVAVLNIYEEEHMLEKSVALGKKLKAKFDQWTKEYQVVGEVRGLGAMLGIAIVGPDNQPSADKAKKLLDHCLENGLIVLICGIYGHVLRCLCPFVITDEQLEKAFSIIESGLKTIS
ncbi:MAG: 4-aminobutyrate--2-oxoglutarate transaminase [Deltaproteobacteria bacterium]|nr:4-aminobutyrate--2-oxoglutarate transaminase [Deltaproteobacteria bacterium]